MLVLIAMKIFFLSLIQGVSKNVASRSGNRDSRTYHLVASTVSHILWFFMFQQLYVSGMNGILVLPYVAGGVCGALLGAEIAIKIENKLGAKT
jgi:uncharacterized membrane protein YfcA